METKVRSKKSIASKAVGKSLPIIKESCSFEGYDADILMSETENLRELITKRGTLEILIPLCCTTDPVRYIKFRRSMKGFRQQNACYKAQTTRKKWDSRKESI